MFSWFTRHVAYFFFLTTAAFRLSKGKGNRIIYISGRQQIFLNGFFVRLHSLSFLRLIYPFLDSLVCNSVYRASFLFRTESKEFFLSLIPCMAKKWRGLLHALSILIFFSENAPFLVCGSLEYQISHPRLQASYFLPGNNEFVLSKKAKKEKCTRKLSH